VSGSGAAVNRAGAGAPVWNRCAFIGGACPSISPEVYFTPGTARRRRFRIVGAVRVRMTSRTPMIMADSPALSDFLNRHGVTSEDWRAWSAEAQRAAGRLRIAFAREVRGASGGMTGSGSGVSIDFKDHRRYLHGDDPRHINWQAYARTGNPVLKVFHEEVSPQADIVVDVSASHAHEKDKLAVTLRLALFACVSAQKRGASVRLFLARGEGFVPVEVPAFLAGRWDAPAVTGEHETTTPVWHRIPWRSRAMRLIVSDLLFPGEPEGFLAGPSRAGARTVILAPYSQSECEPDWSGHVVLSDCETGEKRERRAGVALKAAYLEAYRRHFALWDEAVRRRGVTLARVPAAGALSVALLGDPLRVGAVEPV
jgi:uncharacterized protein (DUF58 family)